MSDLEVIAANLHESYADITIVVDPDLLRGQNFQTLNTPGSMQAIADYILANLEELPLYE